MLSLVTPTYLHTYSLLTSHVLVSIRTVHLYYLYEVLTNYYSSLTVADDCMLSKMATESLNITTLSGLTSNGCHYFCCVYTDNWLGSLIRNRYFKLCNIQINLHTLLSVLRTICVDFEITVITIPQAHTVLVLTSGNS